MSEMELAPNVLRAFATQEIKAVNKERREILHMITTSSVDRAGDVVVPGGAQIDNYMKNPVVMANHSYRFEDIVGRALSLNVTQSGIEARTQFRDTPLARDAFALASESLGGWSIGFRPVKYESIDPDKGKRRGFRYEQWELLEYSIVAIPMNQDIVNQCVQRGLVAAENVPYFFSPEVTRTAEPAPVEAKATKPIGDLSAVGAAISRAERAAVIESARRRMLAALGE